MNKHKMIVVNENDLNFYADNKRLEDFNLYDFQIPKEILYKASVIVFESEIENFRKVLKNRFGKSD